MRLVACRPRSTRAAAIQAGHLDVVVAAGVESMSRVPMGSNLGAEGWAGLNQKIAERWPIVPQGISAEEIAKEWKISREQLDAFALESNLRAIAAIDGGLFEREIVPGRARRRRVVHVDEAPRRDTSAEKLASLKPAFIEDGVVTAGNSSQIVDGAAAMLVVSEAAAGRLGLTPRARFVSFGIAGVDPFRMLHGNPGACAQALGRAGLGWDDMAVIEINEAFASVVLQTLADTGQHARWEAGTSTRTVAASHSAIRSAPPAPASPRRCSRSSSGVTRATASRACASARARRSQP